MVLLFNLPTESGFFKFREAVILGNLGPPVVPFLTLFWGSSPKINVLKQVGTLILTSLLEDLVTEQPLFFLRNLQIACSVALPVLWAPPASLFEARDCSGKWLCLFFARVALFGWFKRRPKGNNPFFGVLLVQDIQMRMSSKGLGPPKMDFGLMVSLQTNLKHVPEPQK